MPLTRESKETMQFKVDAAWVELPEAAQFVEVAGVAVDSRDRVFVFNQRQTTRS